MLASIFHPPTHTHTLKNVSFLVGLQKGSLSFLTVLFQYDIEYLFCLFVLLCQLMTSNSGQRSTFKSSAYDITLSSYVNLSFSHLYSLNFRSYSIIFGSPAHDSGHSLEDRFILEILFGTDMRINL